ncbi:MAG: UDP-N-acetylmuramate dehydrogenase [Burkholderiales bacterium]|nr:UDP-N-acetylmuramate dehydrogenase [Phycisphaerae bacterium]
MQLVSNQPFAGLEEFVVENEPLARFTWYKIGGPARYLIRPRSVEELQEAARRCVEANIPIYVLGLGANLLVADRGVDGAVFRFSEEYWRQIAFNGTTLTAGSGVDMQKLLVRTIREGLSGIESLAGIPGTVGGGVRMNCGGKFGDIGSVVSTVTVMDPHGQVFTRTKEDLVFDYRKTNIVAPFILGATIELEEEDPHQIMARTKEIWMYKRNTQPLNTKNCGCIFKNPRGLSAGALIDQSGLKALRVGQAEVSSKHANFIVAHPGCTSEDVLKLVHIIKERVFEKSQVVLESEVKIWPI